MTATIIPIGEEAASWERALYAFLAEKEGLAAVKRGRSSVTYENAPMIALPSADGEARVGGRERLRRPVLHDAPVPHLRDPVRRRRPRQQEAGTCNVPALRYDFWRPRGESTPVVPNTAYADRVEPCGRSPGV